MVALRLHLLRHGKASSHTLLARGVGAQSYDALHPKGIEQARLLGRALAQRGRGFDRVICGPMNRHVETLVALRGEATALTWPDVEQNEGLREIALDALLQAELPRLARDTPSFRELLEDVQKEIGDAPVTRASPLARLLAHAARAWRAGELAAPGVETWDGFHARAHEALRTIVRESDGATDVLIVSSLGVISCMLDAVEPREQSADMPFRWLATSSISRIVVDGQTSSIETEGETEHLSATPMLVTFL